MTSAHAPRSPRGPGTAVNLEFDVLARYLARFKEAS